MKRTELLQSPEYWTTKIQLELFSQMEDYMKENNLNRTQLAKELGVTKGYISQVLNGDFDHRVSKMVELSLAIGVIPQIYFEAVEQYLREDIMRNFYFGNNQYQQFDFGENIIQYEPKAA